MSGWIVILAIVGAFGVSDIKIVPTSGEAQCKQVIEQMRPLNGNVGSVCVGPDGEVWK